MADDEMSPAPPAPTDARLPLTALQVFKLKQSWKGVRRRLNDTGVEMFVGYFRSNPPSKNLFNKYNDMLMDDLRVNEDLEKLAESVMGVFDKCVQSIEDVDSTVDVMQRTAALHRDKPGFTAGMFMDFEQPFLGAVKITLGDRYTDNMEGIYKTTIRYLLETLMKMHEEGS